MEYGKLTLRGAIEKTMELCPVKIIFNGIILYNDYDNNGVIGETATPLEVIPDRLWQFDKYIVNSINVEIIEFHHSIIAIQGEYSEGEIC